MVVVAVVADYIAGRAQADKFIQLTNAANRRCDIRARNSDFRSDVEVCVFARAWRENVAAEQGKSRGDGWEDTGTKVDCANAFLVAPPRRRDDRAT